MEGNRTLTLAIVWQLMRAYTLALLSQLNSDNTPIVESEIIAWANNKLEQKGVTIRHFQDKVTYTKFLRDSGYLVSLCSKNPKVRF